MNDRQFNGLLAQLEAMRQEQRATNFIALHSNDLGHGEAFREIMYHIEAADCLATTAQTATVPTHEHPEMKSSPGVYVNVPSRSDPTKGHRVWTGDVVNPPHCDCEAFRRFNRASGQAECWHIVIVHDLGQTCPLSDLQDAIDAYANRQLPTTVAEHGGSREDGPLVRRTGNG